MSHVIHQLLLLFLVMVTGFVAGKIGIMHETFNRGLSKLVLDITLPAMVISAVINGEHTLTREQVLLLLLLSVVLYVFLILMAWIFTAVLRVPKDKVGLYRYLFIFSNIGFLGFPVVSAVFGESAVFYASVFQIPFCFLTYTLGISLIAGRENIHSPVKAALQPGVIAPVLALILYLLNVPVPSLVGDFVKTLGSITTPAASLIVGATIAGLPIRKLMGHWRLYPLSLLKLVAFPLLLWLLLRGIVPDPVMLGVTVILCGMPVASNATMICHEYKGDAQLSAAGVMISTVLSLLTIPLLVWFLLGGAL
ncbi:MAG: AEC family transporter [Clostridia bacterium]|nr:AEC family transporter [Clostridia bacterium]